MRHADTGVIYMGASEARAIAAQLLARGKPPGLPVVAVENASLPGSRRGRTTLAELPQLAGAALAGPVVLLLGEVFAAALRSSERDDPAGQRATAGRLRAVR